VFYFKEQTKSREGVYQIPSPENRQCVHFFTPDPVFQYFDFPIYHVETGSCSSIPSPVDIRLRPDATRNPEPAPDPTGFEKVNPVRL
jgi:hypothetical protein